MNKNWLIRTKNNHILGPVSKEKIKELLENGSIKGDDEVCSGNGYWIYVREADLLDRYIYQGETQEFNPVQEALPSEITSFPPDYSILREKPGEDNHHNQVNQTLIQKNPLLGSGETAPATGTSVSDSTETEGSEKKKTKRVIKRRTINAATMKREKKKSNLTYNVLMAIVIVLLAIVISSILGNKSIFSSITGMVENTILPSSAYAQTIRAEKKKVGFHLLE